MRYHHQTSEASLRSSSYSIHRRETLNFEAMGGERYFAHDAEARPLARIYQFPIRVSARLATRYQRKA